MNFTVIDYVLIFILIVYLVLAAKVAFIDGPKCYWDSLVKPVYYPEQNVLPNLLYSTRLRCVLTGLFWFPVAIASSIWVFGVLAPRLRKRFGKKT